MGDKRPDGIKSAESHGQPSAPFGAENSEVVQRTLEAVIAQATDVIDTASISLRVVQVENTGEVNSTILKVTRNKAAECIPSPARSSSPDQEGDCSSIVTVQRSHECKSFCATPLTRTASTASVASSLSTLRPGSSEKEDDIARDESAKVHADPWHVALAEAHAPLELFTDRPRHSGLSLARAQHTFRIDTPLKQLLASLSVEHKLSFSTTILVGWSIVLSRLTGQEDILVGLGNVDTPIMPVRIDLAGDPNTPQLLARVRDTLLVAGASPDLKDKCNTRLLPLFPGETFPSVQAEFYAHGDQASDKIQNSAPASVDIELHLHDAAQDAFACIRYPTALFNADTIERHAGYLVAVLMNMVINGSQSVATIDIISPAEKTLVLKTWNESSSEYPADRCVQRLFEEQVDKSPDAVAIVHENQSFTYLELDALADRIAHKLVHAGIKQGDFVTTLLPRSVELVAAQLAVLKVGAAYVPIDPKAPLDRQVFIVNDSASRLLITDIHVETATALDLPLLRIDIAELQSKEEYSGVITLTRSSQDAAYVMYTSGSTGRPKGVMVLHQGIVRLVMNNGFAPIGPGDRVAFAANPAFDASTFEVWAPLLNGGCLVVIDSDTSAHPKRLEDALKRYHINTLWLTMTLFNQYVCSIGPALAKLKYLLCGGEQGNQETFAALLKHGGPQNLINGYGPTEATTFATTYNASRMRNKPDRLPIGRPIGSTYVYVLDKHGNLAPLGAVGELHIAGAGVAAGYLNRPDLTAEKFLPNPFSKTQGAYMYKSGDLVRYLPDGNLVFVGRNDDQVKIRGFRIELGEIEARLVEHDLVRESVVLALGEGSEKRLVAYVVAEPTEGLAHTLRSHIEERLPVYMIPAAFVRLGAIPVTANGKIDRRALPEPQEDAFARQAYEVPCGETEDAIAAIWSELLGVNQISRHDSFFALGGHSLLVVKMLDRLHRLGLTVSVRVLFESPTLSVLAQDLSKHQAMIIPPNLITLETSKLTPEMLPLIDLKQDDIDRIISQVPGGIHNIQDVYSLAPLQDGILFHHLLAAEGDPYLLISHLAFRDRVLVDRYLDAFQKVVDRHDILRTAVFWDALSTPAQVVLRSAPLSVTEHVLDPAAGPVADKLSQRYNHSKYRMDLTQAPLLRFALAEDIDGRWIMAQMMHHLIIDHAAIEVMNAEVEAVLEGREDTLSTPPQFRDLVAQVRAGPTQEEHEHFFAEMLGDIEEPTFPFGLTEVHSNGDEVKEAHMTVPQDLNDRLRAQAKRLGVTLAALCHTAWAQVLARTSGQDHVVFGTVLVGGLQGEQSDQSGMGISINTLPFRCDMDDRSVQECVSQIHSRLAALVEHENASLALAQRCSGVPAGSPLFSALMNYRHTLMPTSGCDPSDIEFTAKEERVNYGGIDFLGGQERTNYPFTLSVEDFGQALGLTAQVLQPVDPADVCRYVQQALSSLVLALENAPDMAVSDLDVLPLDERTKLLQLWNATNSPYPDHLCVHALFEQQVKQSPITIAVEHGDQSITYAQLNITASHLAYQLSAQGIGHGDRVATYLPRSFELITAQLAILKIGANYVPIDPKAPLDRQAYIVSDSGSRLVITDEDTDVPVAIGAPLLRLTSFRKLQLSTAMDAGWRAYSGLDSPKTTIERSSLETAYIMYTSGSTGLPKGVMVPHRGIARLVFNNSFTSISSSDRIVFGANPAFDASTFEVWAPLLNGGRVVIIDAEVLTDSRLLAETIETRQVTVLFLTPALFNQYAESIGQSLARLRYIISGGEQGNLEAYSALLRHKGPVQIINAYGPTEATMVATTFTASFDVSGLDVLPIGRPIGNTQVYVLDQHRHPVPMGVVGELYISGPGVANGYLNRLDLTEDRFFPDPFTEIHGSRMYKSGDMVRYLPDGNLVYMGRNDDQIKIRGFRVELGEIEARLVQHSQVRNAVVVPCGEVDDKRLVAYIAADPSEHWARTLHNHLASTLPEYMIPSAFVQLDALPMNNNGKIDRRALPTPDASAFATENYVSPQGRIECALAEIWAEVLKVPRVGRHDNFFLLGGHSLLAVRLMNRISTLGAQLPLSALFASPTLSSFAQAFKGQLSQDDQSHNVIPRVSRSEPLELSFSQQRLWFLAQMEGVSEIYHIPSVLRLRGTLNLEAWQRTLDTLFARHESLRTVFSTVQSQPQIKILPADLGLPLVHHDLRGEQDKHASLKLLSAAEAIMPFDLERGPLIRAQLIQLTDDEHIFLLTQHHIVSDGWSFGILIRELRELYIAYRNGLPNPLRPLAIQYPDYAAWQRCWLNEGRLEAQSAYWKKTLAEAPVSIELPTDRPRPPQQSFTGASVPVRVDAHVTQALKALSQKHGATMFMVVLSAWSAVLSRLSGQDDIVIGSPSANRGHEQVEQLIGFFVNTLALRVDLSGQPNMEQLLKRVRETTVSAQAHQDLPFEQVVEIAQPPRRMDQTPLFQVLFAWQNNDIEMLRLPDLDVTVEELSYDIVKFDLELELYEDKDEICGCLHYSTALFDASTVARHVGYLEAMLRAMATNISQPIETVELLGSTEEELLLQTWNQTEKPFPDDRCIHGLFEDQVERSPDAIAVVHDDRILTYRELNVRADIVAFQLARAGVRPGDSVLTLLSRSINSVVSQIAILKAGAVYVPMDPKAPADRLAYMAADSCARLLVTDECLIVPISIQVPILRLENQPSKNPERHDIVVISRETTANDTAYVMYTSGSTGLPKGVMVSHRAITRLVVNNRLAHITSDDRMALSINPTFDPSTFEVWAPLLHGAQLVILDHDIITDAQCLAEALDHNDITFLVLPMALFHQFAFVIAPALSRLRYIMCGGEQGSIEAFSSILQQGGRVRLINGYGPTEVTTVTTAYVATGSLVSLDRLPIGRPISNTRVYVLDKLRRPVPLGAVGELYIGGPGVATGYLNRPELTAERFLTDPFSKIEGARMYKSGDLVRYLSDGNLIFMGRNDDQVKIRGFRVELGEIEERLLEHALVRETVVVVTGEGNGKRLVAYIVSEPTVQLPVLMREHLGASLPEYMIPTAFVRLETMPLTNNGKVDRRALPEPDSDSFVNKDYEEPQGEVEMKLAAIWSELLKVDKIGRQDNFFMLGGHSLLAVQMIGQLRRIGFVMSVRALFETPVLSVLAASITRGCEVPETPATPVNLITATTAKITPDLLPLIDLSQDDIDRITDQIPGGVANIQDIYSLSPLQDGILFHHMMATEDDPYLLTICTAFRDRDLLERYLDAIQQIVDRHDILRTAIVWRNMTTPAQVVLRKAAISVTELTLDPANSPIIEQLRKLYDARKHRIELDVAPLNRYAVAQDTDGRWIMIQMLHHIVGDHSTLELMDEEIQKIFSGRGETLAAPQPFRNLIAQVRSGLTFQEHEEFFSKMLSDIDAPALPYGLSDVHREGANVTETQLMLPQKLNDRLRSQARRLGVSLASLCHLAWAQVIAATSGQYHVVFGTVLFGRMQGGSGADRAMGLFINTLPLRVDVEKGSILESVHKVQTDLATLLEHEHASLALAQRCSSIPSGSPLFSALLNYRHNDDTFTQSELDSGIEIIDGHERTNYPFVLSVEDCGTSFGVTVQVVEPYASASVCGYMQQVLQSLADALEHTPDAPIQGLKVIPAEEHDLLIHSWNRTDSPFPAHECVHHVFENQVRERPEAIALVHGDQTLTYCELNTRANNLARQLLDAGVKPGDLVPTLLSRSIDLVTAQLAIVKAGAAYVPIDVKAPADRQAYIVSDSGARLLVTGEHTVVHDSIQAQLFRLGAIDAKNLHQQDASVSIGAIGTSCDTAYVMYTSGSTGMPKGVMIPHRGITRLVINNGHANYGPDDCVVFGANPAFDASTIEVWAPLLNGGRLVIVDADVYTDAQRLAGLLERYAVTVLFLTPVLLNHYVPIIGQSLSKLRYLLSGGEQGSLHAYSTLLHLGGRVRLINAYGPTESTTIATTYEATISNIDALECLPIGRPMANTQVYVLDKHFQPVPTGAVGELYIGGAGLANGYLNRPDLTAELFLPNVFSKDGGARMYRTGDLVKYLPDGNLVFMGRNDEQVKIRGFRIELGEIETRLVEHELVTEAVVVALGNEGDKRLVAYVVAESAKQLASTLREHISTSLPEYMVPAAFVRLDALPFTANGKLDRRHLPAPDASAFVAQDYEAPRGDIEISLAEMWTDLLKIDQVGRHDNFFTLGGHSLLAVQMIEQLRRIGLSLSVRALFDTPVLSVLAASLNTHQAAPETPANLITAATTVITPDLLPLIDLTQGDIDCIVDQVPGGVANVQDVYSLSPLQDGILFHHMMATEGDPYLLIAGYSFRDRELLDRYLDAVQQIVDRHDILRTAIVSENLTVPAQVVLRKAPLSITELKLDPSDGAITSQLMQLYDARKYRIELRSAPLTRFIIAQDADGRWIMVQLLHHIIGDHSTLEIMDEEIKTILGGKANTLPAPQPFRNLVAQVRLGLTVQEHEEFFSKMLSDIDTPALPYGLSDVHREGAGVTETHLMLPPNLNDRLRRHAKRLGVSPASLCHLAWAQVIAATSGQRHVVFGTVLFGRMQGGSGADRTMGLFINTLPLRVDIENNTVLESVRKVQTDLATLLEHEHASLALAQRCSSIPSGSPLFSALLNYRHNATPFTQVETYDGVEAIEGHERTNYPFVLSVEDFGTSFGVTVQVVEPYASASVCGYMQQVLQSLADALEHTPDAPIQGLKVIPAEEHDLLIHSWNQTESSFPAHQCVHHVFENQVRERPEAIALVHGDQTLTYRELNARVNNLARQLMDAGVKPGDLVPTLLSRSIDLVIVQLAIVKAGAAYVPIDVKAPADRQAYIVSDSGARLLVTGEHTVVHNSIQVQLFRLRAIDAKNLHQQDVSVSIGAIGSSCDTAYVMYTSGSTGMPKGVMIPHRGITRLVINNGHANYGSDDCVVFGANPAFDASTIEVWAPLLNGGRLVIVDADVYTDAQRLAGVLERYAVTVLFLTPVLLNHYVPIIGQSLSKLRYLLSGGEQGSLHAYSTLLHLGGRVRLINAYGPTESTTIATTYEATISNIDALECLPIGRPMANTQVYVLDKHFQPVPTGAVGELYIGGAGLANGYLNRPDLTAELFLPNVFSKDGGARMYRTGDLVKYLPDGNLVFMGRNDEQVKIRGFRIELGEIEARLVEHELVTEAVVLALGSGSEKRLVAYVVAEHNEELLHILREHLAASVPEYMIPAAFVRLDQLPVTNNGKVDRRALPDPEATAFASTSYELPSGDVEIGLAEIWAELLSLDRVGRHDNFFMLGGHSLLAVRMAGSVRSRLGLDLKLHSLFAAPTVAELAQKLVQGGANEDDEYSVIFPLKTSGNRPPLFCIHSGLGLSWPYIGLVKHLHPEQPVYGVQARGLDGRTKLATSVEEMTLDYMEQIRRIQPHGPYHLLGWSFGGTVAHSMATELEKRGEQVPLLAIMDSTADYSIVAHLKVDEIDGGANFEHLVRFGGDVSGEDGWALWERTKPINDNSFVLAMQFKPSVYNGNILFFRATQKENDLTPMVNPFSWRPYTNGAIEVHNVECTHIEMDKPESMAIIGRTVTSKLQRS
uniref:Malpibaldin synthetase n=1 Tax=Mortierella alpina TaxID=64518 RepID=MPBA_MORAP|nr:RecName: Full=Malpibaldin synthetase; AltName: Full=Nonribosomal peptide synthetase mpbA; Short=NRPS mpbA [Mortierella alpina]QOW41314.1 malpibaldin synthetase [Mortierella alpina]